MDIIEMIEDNGTWVSLERMPKIRAQVRTSSNFPKSFKPSYKRGVLKWSKLDHVPYGYSHYYNTKGNLEIVRL